jgi:hypothetical protein
MRILVDWHRGYIVKNAFGEYRSVGSAIDSRLRWEHLEAWRSCLFHLYFDQTTTGTSACLHKHISHTSVTQLIPYWQLTCCPVLSKLKMIQTTCYILVDDCNLNLARRWTTGGHEPPWCQDVGEILARLSCLSLLIAPAYWGGPYSSLSTADGVTINKTRVRAKKVWKMLRTTFPPSVRYSVIAIYNAYSTLSFISCFLSFYPFHKTQDSVGPKAKFPFWTIPKFYFPRLVGMCPRCMKYIQWKRNEKSRCPPIGLSVCSSVRPFVCPSVRPFVCPSCPKSVNLHDPSSSHPSNVSLPRPLNTSINYCINTTHKYLSNKFNSGSSRVSVTLNFTST